MSASASRRVVCLCLADAAAGRSIATDDAFGVTKLASPRGDGTQRSYLIRGGTLLELTRVGSGDGVTSPASWFIGDSVKSDGSIVTATEVDPLFLLLPLLEAGGTCFSPLSQFLVGSSAVLLSVAGVTARACAVCEQREGFGGSPEDVLVRLDRAKASSLLAAKIRRTAALLQARSAAASHRARAAGGSFFAGTTAGGGAAHAGGAGAAGVPATAVALASEVDMAVDSVHMEAALGLFADYLSDAWLLTLATELSISLEVSLPWLAAASRRAAAVASSTAAAGGGVGSAGGAGASGAGASGAGGLGGATAGAAVFTPPTATVRPSSWNDAAALSPLDQVAKYCYGKGRGGGGGGGGDDKADAIVSGSGKLKPGSTPLSVQQKRLVTAAAKQGRSKVAPALPAAFFKKPG